MLPVHTPLHAPRWAGLIRSPFERLRALLGDAAPGLAPIDMSIGEPRHPMPPFVRQILEEHAEAYGRYPPITGVLPLRAAIARWLERRYPTLSGAVDPEAHVLPLSGSREGLFSAVFIALERKAGMTAPAVLIPNPFYQAYTAGALVAGACPVFLPAAAETGFLPDLEAIPQDVLRRTAAFYLASPANPQGAVASKAYLQHAVAIAREHDFVLFVDECYSEIYVDSPPPGALEAAHADGGFANVIVFNSLSKRSNLPGLRSGFVAGDEAFIRRYAQFRNVACPQMPLPVQFASAAVWDDEQHVRASRALYREKFARVREIFGFSPNSVTPPGGFFLWLDVEHLGGGETATLRLWREFGVKVLPGAYLTYEDGGSPNPGAKYIRIALVDDIPTTEAALRRIAPLFTG